MILVSVLPSTDHNFHREITYNKINRNDNFHEDFPDNWRPDVRRESRARFKASDFSSLREFRNFMIGKI